MGIAPKKSKRLKDSISQELPRAELLLINVLLTKRRFPLVTGGLYKFIRYLAEKVPSKWLLSRNIVKGLEGN